MQVYAALADESIPYKKKYVDKTLKGTPRMVYPNFSGESNSKISITRKPIL